MKKPALSKSAITGIGGLLSIATVMGTIFLGVLPLQEKVESSEMQVQQMETTTIAKEFQLQNLQEGVSGLSEAESEVENYEKIISTSVDIESASRAISSAKTSGVEIVSFTFGTPEAITPREEPTSTLDPFPSPFEASGTVTEVTSGEEGATTETASSGGIQRVPLEITVDASSKSSLTEYINELARQDRLIFVTTIDANTSTQTSATIYGYAFFEGS